MIRHTTALAAATLTLLALTACGTNQPPAPATKPSAPATQTELPQDVQESIAAAAGLPPEPTGAKRAELLAKLVAVNPGIGKDEDKAIDAARNQCQSINNGSNRLDWLAAQRFSYRGNTVTDAEGKELNKVLKDSGFCKV